MDRLKVLLVLVSVPLILILTSMVLPVGALSPGEPPPMVWEKTYGNDRTEIGAGCIQAQD